MSESSSKESFELLRFSERYLQKLRPAREEVASGKGFAREKKWLADAEAVLEESSTGAQALLERCRSLPELADFARESAEDVRGEWVDALERLWAGVTFHAGARSPMLEALFPTPKMAALRKSHDASVEFATEFARRLKSGYVTRMLSQEHFAFAPPVLEAVASAYARWQESLNPKPLDASTAEQLRLELAALAERAERGLAQARLLCEAALLPFPGVLESSGLNSKPKRRAAPRSPSPVEEAAAADAKEAEPEAPPPPPSKGNGKRAPQARS
jgi:hypothetical protein